ncbi:MAG: hypothetical protein EOP84_32720 [Verrucomicrobiaceae bacterium]|nr:MAG: hypothetical protein EOP84_32720 [Verrucomicrobiaceae bacterium]
MELPEDFEVRRVNESLTREACSLLRAYQKHRPDYGRGREVIKEHNQLVLPLMMMAGERLKVAHSLFSLSPEGKSDLLWMENRLEDSLMEEFAEDGTEITSEHELLKIRREWCVEFAKAFQKCHGFPVPLEMIPTNDLVSGQDASKFLHECRCLFREETDRLAREKQERILERKKKRMAQRRREEKRPLLFWKSVRWIKGLIS